MTYWIGVFLDMEYGLQPTTSHDKRKEIQRWFGEKNPKLYVHHKSDFVERLRLLKNKIGLMDNEAQLLCLNSLHETKPDLVDNVGDNAAEVEAQANYQMEVDYNNFIGVYKEYLSESIAGTCIIVNSNGIVYEENPTGKNENGERLIDRYKKTVKAENLLKEQKRVEAEERAFAEYNETCRDCHRYFDDFITDYKLEKKMDTHIIFLRIQHPKYEKMFDYERRYLPNKKLSLEQNELFINETKKIVDFIKAEKRLLLEDVSLGGKHDIIKLSSIFNEKNNSYEICIDLFEYLEITIAGIPNTKKGRTGKLTGMITAIKQTPGMLKLDKPTDMQLLKYFNTHLQTDYKTFAKRNEDFKVAIDDATRFIGTHFKK